MTTQPLTSFVFPEKLVSPVECGDSVPPFVTEDGIVTQDVALTWGYPAVMVTSTLFTTEVRHNDPLIKRYRIFTLARPSSSPLQPVHRDDKRLRWKQPEWNRTNTTDWRHYNTGWIDPDTFFGMNERNEVFLATPTGNTTLSKRKLGIQGTSNVLFLTYDPKFARLVLGALVDWREGRVCSSRVLCAPPPLSNPPTHPIRGPPSLVDPPTRMDLLLTPALEQGGVRGLLVAEAKQCTDTILVALIDEMYRQERPKQYVVVWNETLETTISYRDWIPQPTRMISADSIHYLARLCAVAYVSYEFVPPRERPIFTLFFASTIEERLWSKSIPMTEGTERLDYVKLFIDPTETHCILYYTSLFHQTQGIIVYNIETEETQNIRIQPQQNPFRISRSSVVLDPCGRDLLLVHKHTVRGQEGSDRNQTTCSVTPVSLNDFLPPAIILPCSDSAPLLPLSLIADLLITLGDVQTLQAALLFPDLTGWGIFDPISFPSPLPYAFLEAAPFLFQHHVQEEYAARKQQMEQPLPLDAGEQTGVSLFTQTILE